MKTSKTGDQHELTAAELASRLDALSDEEINDMLNVEESRKRLRLTYGTDSVSLKELNRLMDHALGDRDLTDVLREIRED